MTQKIITQEGLEKLQNELKALKEIKLPDIIEKIEQAKELGDLSENAEYHDAKEQQGFMVSRIREIESILKNAIVTEKHQANGAIDIGATFVVEDQAGNKKEFSLVGFNEADPIVGKISNESPMGEAFLGKKQGDTVEVEIPKGIMIYKVIDVK
jgi:transcription elongation factor GreA